MLELAITELVAGVVVLGAEVILNMSVVDPTGVVDEDSLECMKGGFGRGCLAVGAGSDIPLVPEPATSRASSLTFFFPVAVMLAYTETGVTGAEDSTGDVSDRDVERI
jgi:hypothetical protein